MKVTPPDWYKKPFYEQFRGSLFERTDELQDADTFLDFARQRSFTAVMHGHKHIPRLDMAPGDIPVFGCGSSVGKVDSPNWPFSKLAVSTKSCACPLKSNSWKSPFTLIESVSIAMPATTRWTALWGLQ